MVNRLAVTAVVQSRVRVVVVVAADRARVQTEWTASRRTSQVTRRSKSATGSWNCIPTATVFCAAARTTTHENAAIHLFQER